MISGRDHPHRVAALAFRQGRKFLDSASGTPLRRRTIGAAVEAPLVAIPPISSLVGTLDVLPSGGQPDLHSVDERELRPEGLHGGWPTVSISTTDARDAGNLCPLERRGLGRRSGEGCGEDEYRPFHLGFTLDQMLSMSFWCWPWSFSSLFSWSFDHCSCRTIRPFIFRSWWNTPTMTVKLNA